jgi:hypothetical protein
VKGVENINNLLAPELLGFDTRSVSRSVRIWARIHTQSFFKIWESGVVVCKWRKIFVQTLGLGFYYWIEWWHGLFFSGERFCKLNFLCKFFDAPILLDSNAACEKINCGLCQSQKTENCIFWFFFLFQVSFEFCGVTGRRWTLTT